MKAAILSILLPMFAFNLNATSLGSTLSKIDFESRCTAELNARKSQDGSINFCSAYLIGFLDGANNPKGCEIKDLNFFIKNYIYYSVKQEVEYFGAVVRSFTAGGCKAL
jgi:hypothetical protein